MMSSAKRIPAGENECAKFSIKLRVTLRLCSNITTISRKSRISVRTTKNRNVFCVCGWMAPNNKQHFVRAVYSIVNEEPNAEEMKAKVKAYEEANKSQIVIRQSQRADEERSVSDRYVHSIDLSLATLFYPVQDDSFTHFCMPQYCSGAA